MGGRKGGENDFSCDSMREYYNNYMTQTIKLISNM